MKYLAQPRMLFALVAAAPSFLYPSPALGSQITPAPSAVYDLNVERGDSDSLKKIGEVQISNDGNQLYVRFAITSPETPDPADAWCLTETRVDVKESVLEFPQRNGMPDSSGFGYKATLDCAREKSFVIPLAWAPGTSIAVAAWAKAERMGGLDRLADLLPSEVTVFVKRAQSSPTSYFDTTITDGTFLDGKHEGWCIDARHDAVQGKNYRARVFSSLATPAGIVDHPEHLDRINWLINRAWVGASAPRGLGTYTYGDVQRAIWTLLDDHPSTRGLGAWNASRVKEIIATANAEGAGYRPACGQKTALVLQPVKSGQATVVPITPPLPCEAEFGENWVGEIPFPCKGKKCFNPNARFFYYSIQ